MVRECHFIDDCSGNWTTLAAAFALVLVVKAPEFSGKKDEKKTADSALWNQEKKLVTLRSFAILPLPP